MLPVDCTQSLWLCRCSVISTNGSCPSYRIIWHNMKPSPTVAWVRFYPAFSVIHFGFGTTSLFIEIVPLWLCHCKSAAVRASHCATRDALCPAWLIAARKIRFTVSFRLFTETVLWSTDQGAIYRQPNSELRWRLFKTVSVRYTYANNSL